MARINQWGLRVVYRDGMSRLIAPFPSKGAADSARPAGPSVLSAHTFRLHVAMTGRARVVEQRQLNMTPAAPTGTGQGWSPLDGAHGASGVVDVKMDSNGNLYVAVDASLSGDQVAGVYRLTPDGLIDPTWAEDGYLDLNGLSRIVTIVVDESDRLWMMGTPEISDPAQVFVGRFTTEAVADETFGSEGNVEVSTMGVVSPNGTALDVLPDGTFVVAVADVPEAEPHAILRYFDAEGGLTQETTLDSGGENGDATRILDIARTEVGEGINYLVVVYDEIGSEYSIQHVDVNSSSVNANTTLEDISVNFTTGSLRVVYTGSGHAYVVGVTAPGGQPRAVYHLSNYGTTSVAAVELDSAEDYDQSISAAVQYDGGGLVLVGAAQSNLDTGLDAWLVTRLNLDLSLDYESTVTFADIHAGSGLCVLLTEAGIIVGGVYDAEEVQHAAVARLTSDTGVLDTTFGPPLPV